MTAREERARALVAQAGADIAALHAPRGHAEVPDAIAGFHAQQAAEKLLKAVLASRDLDYHDPLPTGAARPHERRPVPDELEAVEDLYPYAVQLRYETALADKPLDRAGAIDLIDRLSEWALGRLR